MKSVRQSIRFISFSCLICAICACSKPAEKGAYALTSEEIDTSPPGANAPPDSLGGATYPMSPEEITKKLLAASVPAKLFGGQTAGALVSSNYPNKILFSFYYYRIETFVFEVTLTPKDNGETQVSSILKAAVDGPHVDFDTFRKAPESRNFVKAAMAEHIDSTLSGRPFSVAKLQKDLSLSLDGIQKVSEDTVQYLMEERATVTREITEAYQAEAEFARQNRPENDPSHESGADTETDFSDEGENVDW